MLIIEKVKSQAGKVMLSCSDDGVQFVVQADANLPKMEDYFALVQAEAAKLKVSENSNLLRRLIGVDLKDEFAVFQATQGKAGKGPKIPKE